MTISVAGGNAISWNIVNKNVSAGVSLKQKPARKVAVLAKHLIHLPPKTLHLKVVLEKLVKKERHAVSMTGALSENDEQAVEMTRKGRLLRKPFSAQQLVKFIDSHFRESKAGP
jgi:hypothetical protein